MKVEKQLRDFQPKMGPLFYTTVLLSFLLINQGECSDRNFKIASTMKTATQGAVPLREVELNYEFPERDDVYIDSIGAMPNKGKLKFFTPYRVLTIFEAADEKELIKTIPIKSSFRSLSSSEELPDDSAFGVTGNDYAWTGRRSLFVSSVLDVLNTKKFKYSSIKKDGVFFIDTTFLTFTDPAEPLVGMIALRIMHPIAIQGSTYTFRVVRATREKRKKSTGWRGPNSPDIEKRASEFSTSVVTSIMGKIAGEKK